MSLEDSKCGKGDKQVITILFTETRCNYKKSTHFCHTHVSTSEFFISITCLVFCLVLPTFMGGIASLNTNATHSLSRRMNAPVQFYCINSKWEKGDKQVSILYFPSSIFSGFKVAN